MMVAMSDIVWAVNTGNDQLDDLVNRMRAFAVQLTEVKNIELHFTENENIPGVQLNMEQRKNIYLICKEAISNAVKHSGCTVLDVQIAKKDHQLSIQVIDNGKGFDQQTGKQAHSFGGNGINNMKSRAVEINADLDVITAPGQGTMIKLVVS
jgi:signal transduction histidine kinase